MKTNQLDLTVGGGYERLFLLVENNRRSTNENNVSNSMKSMKRKVTNKKPSSIFLFFISSVIDYEMNSLNKE